MNSNSLILIITKQPIIRTIFSGKDKKLFTPGPLLCSSTIKKAMQRDLGSRDVDFIQTVKDVRSELLKVAGKRSIIKNVLICWITSLNLINHKVYIHFISRYFLKFRSFEKGVDENTWTTVPMQGSGTFSVEAVFQTAIPKGGKVIRTE